MSPNHYQWGHSVVLWVEIIISTYLRRLSSGVWREDGLDAHNFIYNRNSTYGVITMTL